jgi:hypothetical protein
MRYRSVLALIVCILPVAARATVLVPAEFREIVNGSDIIAYGRVTETTARWSDDRKHVDTLITMQVGTYLKGQRGEALVFKVPGGTIGRYMNITVGAPQFTAGEEAVVFLNARGDELPIVFGLNQGVFRVTLDTETKRRIVIAPVMARGGAPEAVVRGAASRKPMPLETFGAEVYTVLAATRSVR